MEISMNDIALFQQELPDYLQQEGLNDLTKSLAGNTGGKRISIRGGVFRMMVNGEEIAKNENRSMNVVIVNGAPNVSRVYYEGKYVAGESTAPDCWSNDGKKPDASIEAPQHTDCEGCPQNIKGSGQNSSRACGFKQRLAVLLADDIYGDVYQLVLPSKSIFGRSDTDKMPFQQYAKYVGSQGKNINNLVTEMRLDSDSDTPKLTFKPLRYLTRSEWEAARNQSNSPAAINAIKMNPSQLDGAKKKALAAPAVEEADAEVEEPKKRQAKKQPEPAAKKDFTDVLSKWSDD
jgi:hypothetical protein